MLQISSHPFEVLYCAYFKFLIYLAVSNSYNNVIVRIGKDVLQ